MEKVPIHSKMWLKSYDKPAILLAKDVPNNHYLLVVGLEKEMWRMKEIEKDGKPALEFVDKIPNLIDAVSTASPGRPEEDQGEPSGQKETRQRAEEETEDTHDNHNEG